MSYVTLLMTASSPQTYSDFSLVAVPGVMLSNAWPESRARRGATLDAFRQVVDDFPFFEAVQSVDIPFADERRAFSRLIEGTGFPYTYALTPALADQKINLSSLDASDRRRAWKAVLVLLDDAREAGASTADAVALCQRLEQRNAKLSLCVDTAHQLLNGEEAADSIKKAWPYVNEIHICNAVLDKSHALYGDWHLPFGQPGVLDVEAIAGIMLDLFNQGCLSTAHRPRVFAEVKKSDGTESISVVEYCQETLQSSWARALSLIKK